MDTISITIDLNKDISENNFDSLQGKSHMDQQGTRTWKKLACDPNRSDSHMQTVSLGKRNREKGGNYTHTTNNKNSGHYRIWPRRITGGGCDAARHHQ